VSGPGAALEFDELSARQILADEVPRQVSPAEAGLEEITLGAEIIDQLSGTEAIINCLRRLRITLESRGEILS